MANKQGRHRNLSVFLQRAQALHATPHSGAAIQASPHEHLRLHVHKEPGLHTTAGPQIPRARALWSDSRTVLQATQPATATGTRLHRCCWRRSSCWLRSGWRSRTASRAACDSAASAQQRTACKAPRLALSSLCCLAQHTSMEQPGCTLHERPQLAARCGACECSARLACCSWPPACFAHACCNPCRPQARAYIREASHREGSPSTRDGAMGHACLKPLQSP